jgi:hypothetical protein
MTHILPVKEHLRNSALYRPESEPLLGEEWKRRLSYQYSINRQLKTALQESNHIFKFFVYIGVPIACITFSFAVYFGLLNPAKWFENIVPIVNFDIPPIGLKETLVFIAVVNGLTFLARKRVLTH